MTEHSSEDSGEEFWSTLLRREGAAQGSSTLPPLSRTKCVARGGCAGVPCALQV